MFDACLLLNTEINLGVFGHDAKWTLIWQQHQYKKYTFQYVVTFSICRSHMNTEYLKHGAYKYN